MNEYVHDADDSEVLGLIVECTGGEKSSTATKYTMATFNMLRKHADFEPFDVEDSEDEEVKDSTALRPQAAQQQFPVHLPQSATKKSINLSYTINLNLPATKDIEVFNAIFKSLKQHLLDQ